MIEVNYSFHRKKKRLAHELIFATKEQQATVHSLFSRGNQADATYHTVILPPSEQEYTNVCQH